MRRFRFALALVLVTSVFGAVPRGERMGYPPEEFAARRQALAKTVGRGMVLLFAASSAPSGIRFRQDHDFFYLTGNESLNAALAIDASTGQSHLFLPRQSASEVRYEGANWLEQPGTAKKYGFTSVQPLTMLHEFMARRRGVSGPETVWTRLSERDTVNYGRVDTAIGVARRLASPFAQHPTEDALRATTLREQFPYYELKDVTPHLDRLRLIKTPREIDILTYNGRISADAIRRAIERSAPGQFEYELEAEATYWLFKHGFQAAAFPAIVGSGPNGNQWHYEDNGRQILAGELVVMDYAGSLDYMTMDITRTWPVSGQFTEVQRKAYDCALEAQKAIIAAIRPGVTRDQVRMIAEDIYEKRGFGAQKSTAYVGHYVGLSVHDVGDWSLPFEAGMVMAIEPIIDLPDQQLHIRIEDTILVTDRGAVVLSAGVPKEPGQIAALVKGVSAAR